MAKEYIKFHFVPGEIKIFRSLYIPSKSAENPKGFEIHGGRICPLFYASLDKLRVSLENGCFLSTRRGGGISEGRTTDVILLFGGWLRHLVEEIGLLHGFPTK
ncbi:hypothetical protein CDAR_591221 [Caerostris darwini]|uniref:Uncharacterized protein n=1 Tax=Caerostris darwini TaxID=1538125 RepID=A0AAV4RP34_9ARAC|nr:hypothetical protein CDAR_591221 [Caerostris darwini]